MPVQHGDLSNPAIHLRNPTSNLAIFRNDCYLKDALQPAGANNWLYRANVEQANPRNADETSGRKTGGQQNSEHDLNAEHFSRQQELLEIDQEGLNLEEALEEAEASGA